MKSKDVLDNGTLLTLGVALIGVVGSSTVRAVRGGSFAKDRYTYKPGAAWKYKSKEELIEDIVRLSNRLNHEPTEEELAQARGLTKADLNSLGNDLRRRIRRRAVGRNAWR